MFFIRKDEKMNPKVPLFSFWMSFPGVTISLYRRIIISGFFVSQKEGGLNVSFSTKPPQR